MIRQRLSVVTTKQLPTIGIKSGNQELFYIYRHTTISVPSFMENLVFVQGLWT